MPWRNAVVLDELGTYEAIGAAEWLVEQGVAVTFVTGLRSFAPRLDAALVTRPALERLRRSRFELFSRAALVEVRPDACALAWLDGGASWSVPADLGVTALPGMPADELKSALEALGYPVYVVGDARHPDTLESAIRDAHLAARQIE
jgi:hypothetical protein